MSKPTSKPTAEALYSAPTVAYLKALVGSVTSYVVSLNKGHVPNVRLLPLMPGAGKTRGNVADASASATTYAVIPETVQVNVTREKRKVGKRTLSLPVINTKNGSAEVVKVSDAWTIMVSVLRHSNIIARESKEARTTADLFHDAVKAILHAVSGYVPGVAGKLADFKALCDSLSVHPAKVRATKNGEPAFNKDGTAKYRQDWAQLTLPQSMTEAIARTIVDDGLPIEPPAELTIDYLRFLRAARDQGASLRKATVLVGDQSYSVRMTLKEIAALLTASGATKDSLVDTVPAVTIRFNADDAREALTRRTREQYKADLADPNKPAEPTKRSPASRPPRIRAKAQPSAPPQA